MPVIADIKCHSPKEGDLLGGRDARKLAKALESAGAPVLSVVTEKENFGGSLELLFQICADTSVPVLRKDFIKRREQILETAEAGASAVLLIASMLEENSLRDLYEEACSSGLAALVEVHSLEEIARVNSLCPELVGINNRDILALERDDGGIGTTENLVKAFCGSPFIVSESAIFTPQDVARAKNAGAGAVLVGTALLKAENIAEKYAELSIRI